MSNDPILLWFAGSLTLGWRYDTGTISGIIAMPFWLRGFNKGFTNGDGEPALNPSDESLIVSILSLGTFLGALTAAPCADFFGRRLGLILSTAIVFNLGVLLQTIAVDQPLFIAGRFFAGYGVGLISAQSKLVPHPHCNGPYPAIVVVPSSDSIFSRCAKYHFTNRRPHQSGLEGL